MITQIKEMITQIKGEKNKKFLLIAAAAVVFLLFDIFFVFLPLVKKSYNLKAKIVTLKKNTASLKQQLSTLDTVKAKLVSLKTDEISYKKHFPKEEDVPALMGSLSTIAGKLSVDIIAIKPVKTSSEADASATQLNLFHEVPIEIVAKGGFHQIGQFINKLETLDKFIEVQDIEITADKATPRRHFFRVLIATYILRG